MGETRGYTGSESGEGASSVRGALPREKELLEVEDVAAYLGVGNVTVHRWCRDGRLPCFKMGKTWRVRRRSLEEFVERSAQPRTLTGRLRSFIEIPDNLFAIAPDVDLMHQLDAAFFQVGAARGGTLVKYHAGTPQTDVAELKSRLEHHGLEVGELESEGRLRFVADREEPGERVEQLSELVSELEEQGRSVWVAFNWEERIDLTKAIEQQRSLSRYVEGGSLVVKTAVLEETLDWWPAGSERRAQLRHSGTIWLSREGLSLSRVIPALEDG